MKFTRITFFSPSIEIELSNSYLRQTKPISSNRRFAPSVRSVYIIHRLVSLLNVHTPGGYKVSIGFPCNKSISTQLAKIISYIISLFGWQVVIDNKCVGRIIESLSWIHDWMQTFPIKTIDKSQLSMQNCKKLHVHCSLFFCPYSYNTKKKKNWRKNEGAH